MSPYVPSPIPLAHRVVPPRDAATTDGSTPSLHDAPPPWYEVVAISSTKLLKAITSHIATGFILRYEAFFLLIHKYTVLFH